MVSSTTDDLGKFREIAADAIREVQFEPVTQDVKPTDGVSGASTWSLNLVDEADSFVGIIAFRYGALSPGGEKKSYTELEYDRARKRGIPCHMFLLKPDAPWLPKFVDDDKTRVNAFRARVSSEQLGGLVVNHFADEREFRGKLFRVLLDTVVRDASTAASRSRVLKDRLTPAKYVLRNAHRGIKRVERLKDMHDAIHRILYFTVYPLRAAAQVLEANRGPVDEILKNASADLERHLSQLYRRFHDPDGAQSQTLRVALEFLQNEALQKVRDLYRAQTDATALRSLARGIETRLSPSFTELAINLCRDELPGLILQMNDALSAINEALGVPGNGALVGDQARDAIQRFVKSTEGSRDALMHDIVEHNKWQAIHDTLAPTFGGTDDSSVQALVVRVSWPSLHEGLRPLVESRHDSGNARTLAAYAFELSRTVDSAPIEPARLPKEKLLEGFQRVRTAFDDEFFTVDSELNDRCKRFLDGADSFLQALGLEETHPQAARFT